MKSKLAESIEINNQNMAYEVVDSLKDLLKHDLIVEVGENSSLAGIERGKPWPNDVVEIEFPEHATSYRYTYKRLTFCIIYCKKTHSIKKT